MTRRRALLCALLILALARGSLAIGARFAAGDGYQYWRLSQQLIVDGRYAFEPGAAPTYTRMPGYPLFLAHTAVRTAPLSVEAHLLRAVVANIVLDFATLALLLAIAHLLGASRRACWIVAAVWLLFPTTAFLVCYGLSETLATFVAVASLALALWSVRRDSWMLAIAAGIVAAFGVLVRADMVTALLAPSAALLWTAQPRAVRLARTMLFGVGALAAFSPWVIRNQRLFAAPHPFATEWVDYEGKSLPTGMLDWMKTWASGGEGEALLAMRAAYYEKIYTDHPMLNAEGMYDDDVEKQEVFALLERHNREGFFEGEHEAFERIVERRVKRAPMRAFVMLPLRRLWNLWRPARTADLPMKAPWLGLPRGRPVFNAIIALLSLATLVSSAIAWRTHRRAITIVMAGVVARSLLIPFVHPVPTQRYLVEGIALALVAIGFAFDSLASRRAREVSSPHAF